MFSQTPFKIRLLVIYFKLTNMTISSSVAEGMRLDIVCDIRCIITGITANDHDLSEQYLMEITINKQKY